MTYSASKLLYFKIVTGPSRRMLGIFRRMNFIIVNTGFARTLRTVDFDPTKGTKNGSILKCFCQRVSFAFDEPRHVMRLM